MSNTDIEEKKIKARIAAKKYRDSHKDKIRQDQKKIREANKDKSKAYSKEYYLTNKEKFQEYSKEYYELNRNVVLDRCSAYYYKHKDGYVKNYRDSHKEEKSEYNKSHYSLHSEDIKSYHKEMNKTLRGRFRTLKYAAKKRKRELNLTFDQYSTEVIKPCFYCNDHFRKNEIGTGVGLDRVDNSKGYILENIVSCCSHCNYLKSDIYSQKQTIAMVQALIKLESML